MITFTNLSILSFILIFFLLGFFFFFLYKINQKENNSIFLKQKNYRLNKINKLKYFFIGISFFLLIISILWPRWWIKKENISSEWLDIVALLDVSSSMKALDFQDWNYLLSRLDYSKKVLKNFIENNLNNRYGLTIFAWESVDISPLTTDTSVFLTFLDWVDEDNLTIQWTNLWRALESAISRFNEEKDSSKVILLFTDWWEEINLESWSIIKNDLKEKWISLIIIWVWSLKWSYIPESKDIFWWIVYKTYNWEKIITKLNEKLLKKISDELDSEYTTITPTDNKLNLDEYLENIEKKLITKNNIEKRQDLKRNFIIVSFIFFILFLIILAIEKNKKIWKNEENILQIVNNK